MKAEALTSFAHTPITTMYLSPDFEGPPLERRGVELSLCSQSRLDEVGATVLCLGPQIQESDDYIVLSDFI